MVFDSVKNRGTLSVLKILERKNSTYSSLFRETKVSHITLQKILKELVGKKFIYKNENYSISEKGRILLKKLVELNEIMKEN